MLGDTHPETLCKVNNLAFLLRSQGKLADAEALFREALDGSRRVQGDSHPRTLATISSLLHLRRAQAAAAGATASRSATGGAASRAVR